LVSTFFDSRAEAQQSLSRGENFLSAKNRLQVGDGERRQIGAAHSTTLVTMKSWFALWGRVTERFFRR